MSRAGLARAFWPLVCVLCFAVIAPVLYVHTPPLQDYPSHMARIHILSHLNDPDIAKYYTASWELRPNLGFEAFMLGLSQVVPLETAGRIFLGLAICVLATSPIALHYALWRNVSPIALFGFPLVFNLALQKGFLSFLLGSGLAIWAFALWVMVRKADWKIRLAVLVSTAIVLMLCHLHAFGVFALIVLSSEMFPDERYDTHGHRLRRLLASGIPLALPLAVMWGISPTTQGGLGIALLPPRDMLWNVLTPMTINEDLSSLSVWALCLAPLVLALVRKGPALHPLTRAPALVLFCFAVFLPFTIFDSNNANWRIFIPLSMLLVAAVNPMVMGRRTSIAMTALAVFTTVTASALCCRAWQGGDEIFAEADRAMAEVPSGSRLFPVILEGHYLDSVEPPSFERIAERAILRGVFVPSILANPRHQPIIFEPSVEALRKPLGRIYYGSERSWPLDWELVQSSMDYILLMHTQEANFGTVPDLQIPVIAIAVEPRFVLYRVLRD